MLAAFAVGTLSIVVGVFVWALAIRAEPHDPITPNATTPGNAPSRDAESMAGTATPGDQESLETLETERQAERERWAPKRLGVARDRHEASLIRSIRAFAGPRALHVVHVEDGTRTGRWRAWLDVPTWDAATLRAEWATYPGALRRLLYEASHPGAVWTALACDSPTLGSREQDQHENRLSDAAG